MRNAIAPVWSFLEANTDHAASGLSFHVEAMAFRGATMADLLAAAVRGDVAPVAAVDESAALATVRPGR